jgi:cyclic 2,3-diphosphoglycerate synthetase
VTDSYLRARALDGRHAASDHFEDAMMGRVVAVGCRRCGGGMAGKPFYSNVPEGAAIACAQEADVVIFEGSGAAIPPVGMDSVMLAAAATWGRTDYCFVTSLSLQCVRKSWYPARSFANS